MGEKRDEFVHLLVTKCKERLWVRSSSSSLRSSHIIKLSSPNDNKPLPKVEFSPQMAGISGIIRKQEGNSFSPVLPRLTLIHPEKHAEVASTLSEAFSDLKNLMDKAKDLVALAEKLRANHTPRLSSPTPVPAPHSLAHIPQ